MPKLELSFTIDTPYLTVTEYAKRTGQSPRSVRREIERGLIPIRPKTPGSKEAVLINMVKLCAQAAAAE
ncbi:hypothetical protein A7D27_08950 [Pseudomonas sp. 1D4]|uniref:hypothetical protein n=1 Tax=Pseudomonadaceae TaxID=135621 RepID=UPI00084AC69C|nr:MULTISPECIES: hypothetical protein [Pseudomonas]OEC43897.1 hypothetical protein A7D27_08950 [Pseudomonas sp. 1D4]